MDENWYIKGKNKRVENEGRFFEDKSFVNGKNNLKKSKNNTG